MNEKTIVSVRNAVGRMGALIMAVAMLCVIDGLTAQMRREQNMFQMLAGGEMVINGPMPPDTAELRDLIIDGATAAVSLRPEEIYKGFWMGGLMWKGEARAASDATPGIYTVSVRGEKEEKPHPTLTFTFRIYPDGPSLRANAPEYVMRSIGFHPYAVAAALLPLAILCGLTVFMLAKKMERDMAGKGKAEIYMIKRSPEGLQISFGLGRDHGLKPGALVGVRNETGLTVGRARVTSCTETDAIAVLAGDGQAELGNLVFLERSPPRAQE
ncbi:hypothetical protein [Desulfolutivibrio sulfoxidireducens]|uniref:hypothetical protein n=1 Tax=Desulfolutivibrio sulfoxidireducens TaxID=2773299 RepID=UPI00159DFE0E|nr:hypothetical protein [Desulfolutivibrio sulfoxidireducens]QLA17482.1 hypothetical protein GD605_16040 [Desulfolutivibrio sulfoxidireducens]QLA21067.1 hypothetical protein GD604_15745 [Desulfolutivibrio sulfoxidireducens]